MDYLVVDLAIHRLNKLVKEALKQVEYPQHVNSQDLGIRFRELVNRGQMSYKDYLIVHTRMILNEFCYRMEEKIGKGVKAGFLFYSNTQHKLYYGAGANYPEGLKTFLYQKTPTVDMLHDGSYVDEIFIVPSMDSWENDTQAFAKVFEDYGVKSLVSKRLQVGDVTLGTFEVCYPYENGPNEDDIQLIRREVQPIKEELIKLRQETQLCHDNLFTCVGKINAHV